jgi:hypothetical protein
MSTTIETVQVRIRRPLMAYKAGQVISVPKGQARSLVLFGKADLVEDEPQLRFAVQPEPVELEVAVAPPVTPKRRGRRPKS